MLYGERPEIRDLGEARRYLTLASEQGHVPAQAALGVLLLRTGPEPADVEESLEWLARAGRNGSADASYRLGRIYIDGQHVTPDGKQAIRWLRPAALGGHSHSAFELGRIYYRGERGGAGVERDLVVAWVWLKIAYERGQHRALAGIRAVERQISKRELAHARTELDDIAARSEQGGDVVASFGAAGIGR
jgi:TPR repeat protein